MPTLKSMNIDTDKLRAFLNENQNEEQLLEKIKENGWNTPTDEKLIRSLLKSLKYEIDRNESIENIVAGHAPVSNVIYRMANEKVDEKYPYNYKNTVYVEARKAITSANVKNGLDAELRTLNGFKTYYATWELNEGQILNRAQNKAAWFEKVKKNFPLPEEQEILDGAYELVYDANGEKINETSDWLNALTREDYGDRSSQGIKIQDNAFMAIAKLASKHELTDKQKQTIEKINAYHESVDERVKAVEEIEEEQKRIAWENSPEGKREMLRASITQKGYMQPYGLVDPMIKLYESEEVQNNPDHPFHKVFNELKEGKVPEYNVNTDQAQHRYVDLITETIVSHTKDVLKNFSDEKLKDEVSKKIDEYEKSIAYRKKYADFERKIVDYEDAFSKMTQADREKVGKMADTIETTKNANGHGETKEFKEMLESMRSFSKSNDWFGGNDLFKAMQDLDVKVNTFVESEKENPENETALLALYALDKVNPAKASERRQELAKNIYDNLSHTSVAFGDSTEFKKFRDKLKEFSELSPDDPKYETVKGELADLSRGYISKKKGGLNVVATQEDGEKRRELAVLTLSLVNPEEAQQLVDQANAARAKKYANKQDKKQINLQELAEKAGFGKLKTYTEAEDFKRFKEGRNKAKDQELVTGRNSF